MDDSCKKASEFLKVVINTMVTEKISKVDFLLKTWKKVVGEKIASHSKIIDVSSGNFIVETDHPGWNQQILFKKAKIIAAVNEAIPELKVRNLFVRVKSRQQTGGDSVNSNQNGGSEAEGNEKYFNINIGDDFSSSGEGEVEDGKDVLFRQFEKLRKTLELKEKYKRK